MSVGNIWRDCMADLRDLVALEQPEDANDIPSKRSEEDKIIQYYTTLYTKYLTVYKNLTQVHDRMVHPQKRVLVWKNIENLVGRILELHDFLVSLQLSECLPLEDIAQDLRLPSDALDLPVPRHAVLVRKDELRERGRLLSALVAQRDQEKRLADERAAAADTRHMTREQAVALIQRNERARQGRLRTRYIREIQAQELEERVALERGSAELNVDEAAVRIQKAFRGHKARQEAAALATDEYTLLGLRARGDPRNIPGHFMSPAAVSAERNRIELVQETHKVDYEEAKVSVRDQVLQQEGADMREAILDQVRFFFIQHREQHGKFPDFPSADAGGSDLILNPPPPPPEPTDEEIAELEAAAKAAKSGRSAPRKPTGGRKEEEEEPKIEVPTSAFLSDLRDTHTEYCEVWLGRDEAKNLAQAHDPELIRERARPGVREEVRVDVDQQLRSELENLKAAVESGKKKKKSSKKKKKSSKKKKKKTPKDPTAERSVEGLYSELVAAGLIIPPIEGMTFESLLGGQNLLASTERAAGINPDPSYSEVKRQLICSLVLPLLSSTIRARAPLTRAMMLWGPPGCGKKSLVHSAANALGANLLVLTPSVTSGNYNGSPEQVSMMCHMVFKVAKLLAPSIIMIDEAHRVFCTEKKAKRAEGEDKPSRIKKALAKEVKALKSSDLVMVVGCSNRPQDGDLKTMNKVFKKYTYVPLPDYHTRVAVLKECATQSGVPDRQICADGTLSAGVDAELVARMTEGFSVGALKDVCGCVYSPRSIRSFHETGIPIVTQDFVSPMASTEPFFADDDAEHRAFAGKLPLAKALVKKKAETAARLEEEASARKKRR